MACTNNTVQPELLAKNYLADFGGYLVTPPILNPSNIIPANISGYTVYNSTT